MTDDPSRSGSVERDLAHRFDAESVERTLRLVGERWTLLILREAFLGVRRYSRFQRNLSIPRPTLSARLATLVETGLLTRVRYASDPDRHEYVLTQAGRDLFPAVATLMRWGDTHLAGPAGPPIVLRHLDCGHRADVRLTCTACGGEVAFHNVAPEPGPSWTRDTGPGSGGGGAAAGEGASTADGTGPGTSG
ncbi:putative HTH-type transcriptional regulator [Streptomyces sulfonofaciens]|uniref:HTH-type transcriptional regulator n=1 Tax=Streptomyces sulfonofaciens TaxID=68272 RepID=A0A919G3G7_9ACTN|nr:helix-turn-helix domain-containing protein [Streptomyces sulfonofaciens]GHH77211.1 putative HTH-type transcriptional regulator [Streptomyces sulfonofaciens]